MAIILVLVSLFVMGKIDAKDLGTYGTTFPIKEENLLEYLYGKLDSMEENDLSETLEKYKNRTVESLKYPKPIHVEEARHYRSRFFNPSITLHQDIKDHKGVTIANKGDAINPLHFVALHSPLLIIDGSNHRHVEWALKQEGRIVLVKGSPINLEEQYSQPIYFDQNGVLVKRFSIEFIPSIVSQDGELLKIEEISVAGGMK